MLEPLYDRVIVRPLEQDEFTKGGIIIPDNCKEKPIKGIVIAKGEGKRCEDGKIYPIRVDVGDVVLFGRYSGTNYICEKVEYLFLKEQEIMAIVK